MIKIMTKIDKIKSFFSDNFLFYTSLLSLIRGGLYVWKGFSDGFSVWAFIIIAFDFLYIPLAFIFKKKMISWFCLIYSFALIFILAFDKTFLYNNFSALFLVCIVFMINSKFTKVALCSYFSFVCVAFLLNEENLIHFFLHIARSLWFIVIVKNVLNNQFNRKKLNLYEDEIRILKQLTNGKVYQKEIEGFSENTVYRKIKNARERNGNISKDELLKRFQQEFPQ